MTPSMRLSVVLAASLLSGCVGGPSPPTHYYVLAPSDSAAAPQRTSPISVELARVTLPEYLNNASFLTRTRSNEVQRAEFDLWAGSLSDEVTRTLGENLSRTLPTDRLSTSGARRAAQVDYVVEVDIVAFERDASNTVQLVARWSLYREDARSPVLMRRSVIRQDAGGSDYASAAAAMSRALGDLSTEIARAISAGASAQAN